MRIVLDARGVRSGMTGIGRYTEELAAHLPTERPDDAFIFLLLPNEAPARLLRQRIEASNVRFREVPVDPESHPRGDWFLHRSLPALLEETKADVFHGPAYAIPAGRRRPRAACVATIHDLSVFTFPKAYPLRFRFYLRRAIARTIRRADGLILDSEHTKREALSLFPKLDETKTCVAHLAQGDQFQPATAEQVARTRARRELPRSYFLMVGTFETRKNPTFFAEFLDEMEKRLGPRAPSVVWAGNRGHGSAKVLEKLKPHVDSGRFRLLNQLAQSDLPSLYQCAQALVYPSLHEGFGLPLLEAMACGLPVVAADATCIPEVVGDGGRVLPLDDVEAWADAVDGMLAEPAVREYWSERALARAAEFSWRKTAAATAEAYARARGEG